MSNERFGPAVPVMVDKEEVERRAKIVALAIAREQPICTPDEQLPVPAVLRCLARVFDFQNGCLLDKPREPTVRPAGAVKQGEVPVGKLREVPVVPPGLEPTLRKQQQAQPQQQQLVQPKLSDSQTVDHELELWSAAQNLQAKAAASNMAHVKAARHASAMPPPNRVPLPCKPIIVVPSELTSLVTLHNIKALLENLRFVPPSLLRRSDKHFPNEVHIVRGFRGKPQQYCAIDNVARLAQHDWQQVVAVFVFNPRTQFKGWPFHGDPAMICRHFCAFHVHLKGQAVSRELETLWLNILSLPLHDRSTDQQILHEFWRKLDEHMTSRSCPRPK